MVKPLALTVFLAGANAASLRAKLESALSVGGAVNCGYKCGLMWNQRQDWGSGFALNEYIACLEGCEVCDGGEDNEACMPTCKSTSWITYTYYFNPETSVQGKVNNDDIAQPLVNCLDGCVKRFLPNPGQGATFDGRLPRRFMQCTQKCYDDKLDGIQAASLQRCRDGAVAGGYQEGDCAVGIIKGVVEPDKACIQGCSQNLCQAGARCNGKGYWLPGGSPGTTGCQLITPQTMGTRNTITPSYFNQQNDLGDCCNAAFERCSYVPQPPVYPASFGVSLGHVIATSEAQCKMPGSKDTFGNIIQNSGDYECNCKNFFENCAGVLSEGTLPDNWRCNYGPGKSCTSAENCENA